MEEEPILGAIGEVVDLFCGVGALSHGLMRSGFDIRAGYDTDRRCKYAFEKNNASIFHARDVATLQPEEIQKHFTGQLPSVLAGCAPCQPFSTYKQRYDEDPRWDLVGSFAKLAVRVQPDFITMENVPALVKYKNRLVFENFQKILEAAGYHLSWQIAKCELYGVPQKRRRLVVIASKRIQPMQLISTHKTPMTVRDAISALPKAAAGKASSDDPLHVAASLSDKNLQRIRASRPGGTWNDWPFELRGEKFNFSEVGRWIGNVVPVGLAETIGNSISSLILEDEFVNKEPA